MEEVGGFVVLAVNNIYKLTKNFMGKKNIIAILITAIIFYSCGLITVKVVNRKNTFQFGWEAARQRLIDTGFISKDMMSVEINAVSGEVQKIDGNKIYLKITPLEPLADVDLNIRAAKICNDTKIYRLKMKDTDKYMEEEAEFIKKIEEGQTEGLSPPDMFEKEDLDLLSIEIGEMVTVMARENIRETKEFEVYEVQVPYVSEEYKMNFE